MLAVLCRCQRRREITSVLLCTHVIIFHNQGSRRAPLKRRRGDVLRLTACCRRDDTPPTGLIRDCVHTNNEAALQNCTSSRIGRTPCAFGTVLTSLAILELAEAEPFALSELSASSNVHCLYIEDVPAYETC
jgi:hypothetical protein